MTRLWYHTMTELPYQEFMEGRYHDLNSIRQVSNLQVFSAWQGKSPMLFIVQHDTRRVLKCEYSNQEKQERDIEHWRHLRLGGDGEAGVGASLSPLPPSLTGSNARPFPPDTEPEQPAV